MRSDWQADELPLTAAYRPGAAAPDASLRRESGVGGVQRLPGWLPVALLKLDLFRADTYRTIDGSGDHAMSSRVLVAVTALGLALGAGMALPSIVSGAEDTQGCERVAASAHPGGLPDGARSVVMAVPVTGADDRVVMGAYWTGDHWSDRITYLVQGSQSSERLRAQDLESAPQGVRAAYRTAFECVQVAVTEETPNSP